MPGPTCAVSPSMVCLPVNTRSTASPLPIWRMAEASANDVASVSAPANARSVTRIASSAPKEMHLRSAASACGGPMVNAVTRPPKVSFKRSASSSAKRSYGLTIAGTPWRMIVLVTGCTRICALSGPCLMQTTMCMTLLEPRFALGWQAHAQGIDGDMAAFRVLEYLEHFLGRRRGTHEIVVGTGEQWPHALVGFGFVGAGELLRAVQVLIEALQDVQAIHVDHALLVRNCEKLQELFGRGKLRESFGQGVHVESPPFVSSSNADCTQSSASQVWHASAAAAE